MTDLWSLSKVSGAKIQRSLLILTNHISSYFNERFLTSFVGRSQLVVFPECFTISPMHLFSYYHSACGTIWDSPRNYTKWRIWKPANISGAMRFLSAVQVHPASNRAHAGTWAHTESSSVSVVTGRSTRFEIDQDPWLHTSLMTFTKPYVTLPGFRWYKTLFPHL